MGMFRRRTSGADGATAVEYAIILGGTVFGLVAIVVGLKTTMGNALSDASDSQAVLSDGSTATPSNGPTSVVLPPAAPSVSAAPGNGQTAITWAPVSGATSYVVTCNGNSVTVTTTGYTCTGLTNGQSYTVTVVAKGSSGTSAPGSATVTPFTTPNAPTNVTADTNDGAITIRWTAPANNGGSPITGYTVTPNPATGGSCTVAGTTATCTGLTDGNVDHLHRGGQQRRRLLADRLARTPGAPVRRRHQPGRGRLRHAVDPDPDVQPEQQPKELLGRHGVAHRVRDRHREQQRCHHIHTRGERVGNLPGRHRGQRDHQLSQRQRWRHGTLRHVRLLRPLRALTWMCPGLLRVPGTSMCVTANPCGP